MSDPTDALPPNDDIPDNSSAADNDTVTDGVMDVVNDPTQPPESEVEGATPPGYDWPTHGGYLGCLVGSIAACLLTGFFGADLFSFFYIARGWPFPLFALLTLVLFVALVVGLGRLGWQLGKRFYRYYPQPKPTWGESDEAEAEIAQARKSAGGRGKAPHRVTDAAGDPAIDEPLVTTMPPGPEGAAEVANESAALVEGRQGQDNRGDGGREAADQAENAHHEPQRP